jgi:RNA polymerase sigma-70 factor (ECF subfamily)
MTEQPQPPDDKKGADLGEIYRQYWEEIVRFARGELFVQGVCGVEPGDIAEESFIVALARFEKFDPQAGSLRAWLCGIARNLIRAARRRN